MNDSIFKAPASADLQGSSDLTEIAEREGSTSSTDWAIQFAQALCSGDSLDLMRERFTALVSAAGRISPDSAASEEIGRHLLILDALFKKLIIQSVEVEGSGRRGSSEAAERLRNGAFKAQRAAMSCLSALQALRNASSPAPITSTPKVLESGVSGAGSQPAPLALLEHTN